MLLHATTVIIPQHQFDFNSSDHQTGEHLGHALKHYNPNKFGRFRRTFDSAIEWIRPVLIGKTTDFLLRFRYLFISSVIALLIISVGLFISGHLSFVALPGSEGDVIVGRILLPQGTPLHRTEQVVSQVLHGLREMNEEFAPEGRYLQNGWTALGRGCMKGPALRS